ncbi:MAG: tRNA (N(6)-L-threonylcarbamoyladenosine(37)-C(2))-methylthiotransferase MtaB [Anaerolineales bacterium]|jgi:threonylcarbamoyladenosine tRNA methylthiotransferase MtaB
MKVYLDMIGCRLNQSELEVIARQFAAAGHTLVGDPADADLAVVNTCTVTSAAAADSRKTIRRIARSGSARIVSTGCWSELVPEQALKLPGVTAVVPNQEKDRLVAELLSLDEDQIDLEPLQRVAIPGARERTRAFIKAQDGCRHRCAFCITTVARGDSRSQPLETIIREVRAAVRSGAQEIVLTGVQLGSWGKDLDPRAGLAQLVEGLLKETEVPRIRLSSIEPWDITSDLIAFLREDRVARHLHLPLQSGSAATLRRMARAINPASYARLIEEIRSRVPETAITTDILTGFPGETEEEYREGLDFIREMGFAGGHVFTYSAREGTPAADFPDQVPHSVRKSRSAEIRRILRLSGEEYRRQFLDRELEVLWEQVDHGDDKSWKGTGLSDNYLKVEADLPVDLWNQFSRIRVSKLTPGGVIGELVIESTE